MAKVTEISLENFRVFKDKQTIKLAPITILTGKNNSGKSSVLKALLLLSSNAKKHNLNQLDFNLHSEKHNLGSFLNVLNDINRDLTFAIKITGNDWWESEYKEAWEYIDPKTGEKILHTEAVEIYNEDRELNISVNYSKNGKYGKLNSISVNESSDKITNKLKEIFTLEIDNDKNSIFNLYWFYKDAKRNNFHFHNYEEKEKGLPIFNYLKNFPDKFGNDILKDKLKNFDQKSVNDFIEDFNMKLFKKLPSYSMRMTSEKIIAKYMNDMTQKYLSIISKIKDLYIEDNEKYYDFLFFTGNILISDIIEPNDLKKVFENTIKYTENLSNHIIKFFSIDYLEAQKSNSQRYYTRKWQGSALNELLLQYRNLLNQSKDEDRKEEFLNYWFGKEGFNLGRELKFIWDDKGIEIKLTKNGRETDLSDLGYGTNQMLALLLKIVTTPLNHDRFDHPGKRTLMLEEPEINLHPNLQSKLADMFVDAHKKFGIHFIIETHSEYLIRKLQYLTVKKEIKPEDTSIYYFTNPEDLKEGEEQVKEIRIKENGVLTQDFGPGFLDEANKLAIELFLLSDSQKN